jgi:hypothetical protein
VRRTPEPPRSCWFSRCYGNRLRTARLGRRLPVPRSDAGRSAAAVGNSSGARHRHPVSGDGPGAQRFHEARVPRRRRRGGGSEAGGVPRACLQSDFAKKVWPARTASRWCPPRIWRRGRAGWRASLRPRRNGVFRQGEAGDCCYVVLAGQLRGAHSRNGNPARRRRSRGAGA